MPLDVNRLRKPFRKLRKDLKRLPKEPSPELVHEMRTSSRRIEAMLAALGLESKPKWQELLRIMGRVRKHAGQGRDMDVLTGYASQIEIEEESECLIRVLEYLGAQRFKKAAKMHGVVRKDGPELRRLLQRCAKQVKKLVRSDDTPNGTARINVIAVALRLSAELREPPRLDKSNLHPYRLEVKQLQYVLQMVEEQTPEQQRFIEKLKQVKDAIGEWHDWAELLSVVEKVVDHGAGCKLLKEVRATVAKKFEHALSVTNEMRARYLPMASGPKKQAAARQKPLPEVVLVAASAAA